jgi:hypothetical protein
MELFACNEFGLKFHTWVQTFMSGYLYHTTESKKVKVTKDNKFFGGHYGITYLASLMGPKIFVHFVQNLVGRQKLKSFNFCYPADFVSSDQIFMLHMYM